ncbi:MAG TPA: type VI secretion system tube protein Hcp [Ramlibacter sp.]|uniref:Hcp family type VI secretion system effector n=1 Tax=Ramlibacter sp. TaxID=1917967 RepID=UPI002C0CFBA6|nr:type VI secretion system tube protein Hcp [Ramlibacter sp.]HVZ43827.1 type VI secretion system tube protein Hcp [Ramlibacter sp.]
MDVLLLEIKDLKGNCTITGHENQIILNTFQHSCALPMSMDAANTERTSGRPVFSEMVVSKMTDQATPALYQACAEGKKLGDATIHIGRNEGGAFMSLMKYTLSNAMVSNISTGGGGGIPSDSFSINYTQIKSEFTQQNADSTKKGTAAFGWNIETNKAAT